MGEVFEEICKQWLWREYAAKTLPFSFRDCGRWWGTNPIKKEEQEIDLLAVDDGDTGIFCECKWRNEPVDIRVLRALMEKAEMFHFKNKCFVLFSKTGFHRDIAKSADERVLLVSFESM